MATKLYVKNLAWATNDDSLKNHFEQAGEVLSAKVVIERGSDRSRGFGFVEMKDDEGAKKALDLDGSNLDERTISVQEARPQEERPERSFRSDNRSAGGDRGGSGRFERGGRSNERRW